MHDDELCNDALLFSGIHYQVIERDARGELGCSLWGFLDVVV